MEGGGLLWLLSWIESELTSTVTLDFLERVIGACGETVANMLVAMDRVVCAFIQSDWFYRFESIFRIDEEGAF